MKSDRTATINAILISEGSELNVSPDEPGGASRYGISVSYLTDYRHARSLPPATVQDIIDLDGPGAAVVYDDLLTHIRFDELPAGVDYRLADIVTNLGLTGGALALQMCLGLWPLTGKYDDATIAAAQKREPKALIESLGAAWIVWKHFQTDTGWGKYGHGWTNRVNEANAAAERLAAQGA